MFGFFRLSERFDISNACYTMKLTILHKLTSG
jgi:hypothetical protein